MKEIIFTTGQIAIVDDDDFNWLSRYSWRIVKGRNNYYAQTSFWDKNKKQNKNYSMHRLIMNNPDGLQVDHINHNGLDNRKENLRICTASQNSMNTHKTKENKYGYKGVCFIGGKQNRTKPYAAQLRYGKKRYYLGQFATPEEAARAYDQKAKEMFGGYACLNF